MKSDETLDQAIDRVAARMTAIEFRVTERVRWSPPRAPALWNYWRMAGAGVGLCAIGLVVAVLAPMLRHEPSEVASDTSMVGPHPEIVQPRAELPSRTFAPPAARVEVRDPPGPGSIATAAIVGHPFRGAALPESPTWGVPLITEPQTLDVAAVDVLPLQIDRVETDPVLVPELTVDALPRVSDSRESRQ